MSVYVVEEELNRSLNDFNDSLYRLARETGKDFGDVVKSNGRLIAINMAIMTQPFSGGENFRDNGSYAGARDRAAGEFAVLSDVGLVYSTIGIIYSMVKTVKESAAKGFWKAVNSGQMAKAIKIFRTFGITINASTSTAQIGKFDEGGYHRQVRNSRGRVGRNQRTMLIVTNPKALRRYVKEMVKRVGWAKGSWAAAARALGGTRGLPQWVTRHDAAPGGATDNSRDPISPHVVLHSRVSYMDQVLSPAQASEALRYQQGKMESHIEKVIIANAVKEGLIAK